MGNISLWIRFVLFGLVISQVKYSDGFNPLAVAEMAVTVYETTVEVGKLAFDIVKFIDEKINGGRTEKLMFELDGKIAGYIESAKLEITTSILENSKMEQLDTIVGYVDSSKTDMKKIIMAENQTYAEQCKKEFVTRYREHHIVKQVRDLKSLLTYSNVVQNFALLPHLAKKTRCNLTALKRFALFYLNLISDGIALQAMYGKITQRNFSLKKLEENEWVAALKEIEQQFKKVENECVGRFNELARKDFNAARSAKELAKNNKERYIYNWIDVMFYTPYHGFEFHCVRGSNFFMTMREKGMNKVAVYGPRNKSTTKWDANRISQLLSTLSVPYEYDKNAACAINSKVIDILKYNGYNPKTVIVYFVGYRNENPEIETFKDKDSPVATYTLHNVVLWYCQKSEFECFWTGNSYANGKYKIYVYPW